MPFYDRNLELETLSSACTSDHAELFIVYGRRGVGKSALLAEAVRSHPHVFYRATRRTLPLQLGMLTDMVREAYPDEFMPRAFDSFDAFLGFLAHIARDRPDESVIAVIDELPYLAEVDSGLLTTLQTWWDRHKNLPNVKLFLAGSYVAFMERRVLDANAPLYNRRTGSMRLEPFNYLDASLFFPRYSPRERIETYAVLGGMPSYLEQFDPGNNLDENLLATAFRRNTYLHEEPNWLLLEDLRRDITYGSILWAIAIGNRKPSGIARAIGRGSAQDIAPQLQSLLELNLVRREVPITDRHRPHSRNSQYWLADNYLSFWYRYVDPNRSLIAQGMSQRVAERVRQSFHQYVARPHFEEVCRQFLVHAYAHDLLPQELHFDAAGSWWNGNRELDVVAMEGNATQLVGSCKWTNAPMTLGDLEELRRTSAAATQLNLASKSWYALFSREGFEPALARTAELPESRLLLFEPGDFFT